MRKVRKDSFHSTKSRLSIYIALEDINFLWTKNEIQSILIMWHAGESLADISHVVKRSVDEVGLLIADLHAIKPHLVKVRSHGINRSENIEIPYHPYYTSLQKFFREHGPDYEMFSEQTHVDFYWDEREVLMFDCLWKDGYSLQDIAEKLKRNITDTTYLVVDRARKEKIYARATGLEALFRDPSKSRGNGTKQRKNRRLVG